MLLPVGVELTRARNGLAVLVAALALTTVAAGCGSDDSPSSDDVPSGAVATIGDVEIGTDRLDEQVEALARAQRPAGGSTNPGSGSGGQDAVAKADREQLETQALSLLLRHAALEQEAADRDIEVGDAEVRQRWEAASQAQFKTKKALRRFLGGQTEQDLLAQLRRQFLTERVHEQVSEEAGGGKKGAKAIEEFRKDFQKRWQDRTACAVGYTAAGCNEDRTE